MALPELRKPAGAGPEPRDETVSEGSIDRIPVRLWVMHGAVMFGREFCYAMETALVTPILLQIGECRHWPLARWPVEQNKDWVWARGPWGPQSGSLCSCLKPGQGGDGPLRSGWNRGFGGLNKCSWC